jgi:protein-S-isoprenylcysteine O-methyltransferase Ste14
MCGMPDQLARAESGPRSLFGRLLELDNGIIGLFICATAAYDWFIFYQELGRAAPYYRFGIYALASLSVLSIFFSAVYLTGAGIILLLLKRPVSRYKTAVPNLVSILAAFATYLFVWAPKGSFMHVNAYFSYLLIVWGSFVMLASLLVLRRAFSVTPQARRLVTAGPYALVRHPMYAGSILVSLGLAFLVDSPQALGLFFICGCLQIWRALYEEEILEASFAEYADYKNRVGRFVPRLKPYGAVHNLESVQRSAKLPMPHVAP